MAERMGRESKLTERTQSAIAEALRAGVGLDVAAGYAGVSRTTLRRWMELGKDDQSCVPVGDHEHQPGQCATTDHAVGECPELAPFRDFRAAVEHAMHSLHVKLAGEIVRASSRDWRAAYRFLQVKWPKTWNVAAITQLAGAEGGPIEIDAALSARARVRERLEALHERSSLQMLPSARVEDVEHVPTSDEADGQGSTQSPPQQPDGHRRKRGASFA